MRRRHTVTGRRPSAKASINESITQHEHVSSTRNKLSSSGVSSSYPTKTTQSAHPSRLTNGVIISNWFRWLPWVNSKSKGNEGRSSQGHYKTSNMVGLNATTFYGSLVLLVCIAISSWFNNKDEHAKVNSKVLRLLQQMTAPRSAAKTHKSLIPVGRTQMAIRNIPAQEIILEMPRKYLIWDLDALRDPWIQKESLLKARLSSSFKHQKDISQTKPLQPYVFLAVYLARLNKDRTLMDPIMKSYMEVLPTRGDYEAFHPIFWNSTTLGKLRMSSSSYDWVIHLQQDLDSNYQALAKISQQFRTEVSFEDFVTAQLNVWTRSFGTGPLFSKDGDDDDDDALYKELQEYLEDNGIDLLSKGCHSMVPILDLYNHFGTNPNVGFVYDKKKQAFVVTSQNTIKMGQEIYDSYGKHTEAHLFGKYGFVNLIIGSDHTEASLALYHPVYANIVIADERKQEQDSYKLLTKQMLRYMQFDDGYQDCVQPTNMKWNSGDNGTYHGMVWHFKQLKFQHLRRIAQDVNRWHVFISPRNPKAKPPTQSTLSIHATPPKLGIPRWEPSKVQLDVHSVMATCRLLVMTHEDYNSNATSILTEGLSKSENESFVPPRTERDALRFREIMCVLRFADMALNDYYDLISKHHQQQGRIIRSLQDQIDMVKELNRLEQQSQKEQQQSYQQSIEWRIAHLQLAEMQALQMLKEVTAQMIRELFTQDENQTLLNSSPTYSMRHTLCPLSYQMELLKL